NSYLDNLEATSGCDRHVIIYEACHAGSFIDRVSKPNRIIVTSTDTTHSAYVLDDLSYAAFSSAFWSSIANGKTVGNAFIDACYFVVDYGYGDTQFPLVDDNHDDVGHRLNNYGLLPNFGDGSDALTEKLQYAYDIKVAKFHITMIPKPFFFNYSCQEIPVWAVIENSSNIANITARFIPPQWTPPGYNSDDEGSWPQVSTGTESIVLTDPDQDNNWTGVFRIPATGGFPMGEIKVNFIALGEAGLCAAASTKITTNLDGNPTPDTTDPIVIIREPFETATVSGIFNVTVEVDDDQSINHVEVLLDGVLVKNESFGDVYPYPQVVHELDASDLSSGNHTITAIAFDDAGNNASITTTFTVAAQPSSTSEFPWVVIPIGIGILCIVIIVAVIRRKRS
ncbi:MAG: Ig-like domain-containing protein, partial [Promethearchaeota archaeon]